jgi:predicted ATPase
LPERDAISLVAAELASEAWMLCFDEFQVAVYPTSSFRLPQHLASSHFVTLLDAYCMRMNQVTDIADALIMRKLFDVLFSKGTIIVCTSNRPPKDLYQSGDWFRYLLLSIIFFISSHTLCAGVNREYFLPFIDVLRSRSNSRPRL